MPAGSDRKRRASLTVLHFLAPSWGQSAPRTGSSRHTAYAVISAGDRESAERAIWGWQGQVRDRGRWWLWERRLDRRKGMRPERLFLHRPPSPSTVLALVSASHPGEPISCLRSTPAIAAITTVRTARRTRAARRCGASYTAPSPPLNGLGRRFRRLEPTPRTLAGSPGREAPFFGESGRRASGPTPGE